MKSPRVLAIVSVVLAIGITTTMDATGLSAFSALPLFPLMGLFWYLGKLSRREMGFSWGSRSHYAVAAVYPVVVMGTVALIAWAAGAIDFSQTDWHKALLNLVLVTVSTILVAILTEEGFFRGWLWASLRRAGDSPRKTLVFTSLAFSLWHLSEVALDTGFDLPWKQIPVFMVNAAVLGAIWGLMFRNSATRCQAPLFGERGLRLPDRHLPREHDRHLQRRLRVGQHHRLVGERAVGTSVTGAPRCGWSRSIGAMPVSGAVVGLFRSG